MTYLLVVQSFSSRQNGYNLQEMHRQSEDGAVEVFSLVPGCTSQKVGLDLAALLDLHQIG